MGFRTVHPYTGFNMVPWILLLPSKSTNDQGDCGFHLHCCPGLAIRNAFSWWSIGSALQLIWIFCLTVSSIRLSDLKRLRRIAGCYPRPHKRSGKELSLPDDTWQSRPIRRHKIMVDLKLALLMPLFLSLALAPNPTARDTRQILSALVPRPFPRG
ncbi:hypothetical protein RSAG8_08202, partial [Rhizoctonia solani AG-8 WAC10335]